MLRSRDAAETARLMVYTAEQLRRRAWGAVVRPGYRPKGRQKRRLFVLQGLPGVGPERAERLLAAFGSVEAVMAADAEDLAAVEGIGEKTAARIRWITGGQDDLLRDSPADVSFKARRAKGEALA